jgi:hypothetical protein
LEVGARAAISARPRGVSVKLRAFLAGAIALASCGGEDLVAAQPAPLARNLLWDVYVASAVIAPTDNGAPWDGNGSPPDPYVVWNGGPTSPVRSDTFAPAWSRGEGVAMTTAQLESAGVQVQLRDSDFLSDEPMTEPRTFVLTDAQIRAGGFTVEGWGGAVKVVFTIAPHE